MRLLGYTRISTTNQDPQLQVNSLLCIRIKKRDIFSGVTAGHESTPDRRGMQKLLEHPPNRAVLVVRRFDRLSRSMLDVPNTVLNLRDRGIQAWSIADAIDGATATGRLMLNMLATLAEYARKLIIERVRAGDAVTQEAGTQFGRPKSDPAVIAQKLAIVAAARAEGKTTKKATSLVGWSRPTLCRHQNAHAIRNTKD